MIGRSRGFTLLEVLVALVILAFGLLAVVPMFVLASKENAAGGDLGEVGALAVERLESLRVLQYYSLQNGGSLTSNVSGFSATSDPDFDVRWVIASKPSPPTGMKQITVRAVANRRVIGRPKQVTLVTVRGE
jgi:prepilin-type N-terminal cleavage/methylation domain-containing protein